MSGKHRIDLLGLGELDSSFAADAAEDALEAGRAARIAARRAFVDMKQLFLRAVENLEHRKGAWLRSQVRAAEDPVDLWLLRGPLLGALREDDSARGLRAELYRSLDSTFPENFGGPRMNTTPLLPEAWQLQAGADARFPDGR